MIPGVRRTPGLPPLCDIRGILPGVIPVLDSTVCVTAPICTIDQVFRRVCPGGSTRIRDLDSRFWRVDRTSSSRAAANSGVAACHPPTHVARVRIPTESVGRSATDGEGLGRNVDETKTWAHVREGKRRRTRRPDERAPPPPPPPPPPRASTRTHARALQPPTGFALSIAFDWIALNDVHSVPHLDAVEGQQDNRVAHDQGRAV